MKITAIELNQEDQDFIFNELIKRFTEEDKLQKIEFELDEVGNYSVDPEICIEAKLELYTDYNGTDENNQTSIYSRSVIKFKVTFLRDGESLKTNDWNIDDRIKSYYEI